MIGTSCRCLLLGLGKVALFRSDHYADFSPAQVDGRASPELVKAHLNLDDEVARRLTTMAASIA